MAKMVTVTKAQQAAAQYTVARSSKSGRSVPNAVRKIAGAERRRPPGRSQPPRTDDRLPAAPPGCTQRLSCAVVPSLRVRHPMGLEVKPDLSFPSNRGGFFMMDGSVDEGQG